MGQGADTRSWGTWQQISVFMGLYTLEGQLGRTLSPPKYGNDLVVFALGILWGRALNEQPIVNVKPTLL